MDSGLPPSEYPSPSGDMLRPLRPPQHLIRNPPTEMTDKASPLPTPGRLPHPTGNENKSRKDFSPPHTLLLGGRGPGENPHPTSDGPSSSKGAVHLVPATQWTPTSRSSPDLRPLSRRDILYRLSTAKRANSIRIRMYKRQHQSMLPDYIGQIHARPRYRYLTGHGLPHLHSQEACPASVGEEIHRSG